MYVVRAWFGAPWMKEAEQEGPVSAGRSPSALLTAWGLLYTVSPGHFSAPPEDRGFLFCFVLFLPLPWSLLSGGGDGCVSRSCPTLGDPRYCSPARLLCPWDFPGRNTGTGRHLILQGIFPTQGSTHVPCIAGRFFTSEPPGKPISIKYYIHIPSCCSSVLMILRIQNIQTIRRAVKL